MAWRRLGDNPIQWRKYGELGDMSQSNGRNGVSVLLSAKPSLGTLTILPQHKYMYFEVKFESKYKNSYKKWVMRIRN